VIIKDAVFQALGPFALMVVLVHACHLFCISFQLCFQFGTYSVDNAIWPQ